MINITDSEIFTCTQIQTHRCEERKKDANLIMIRLMCVHA
uniref:Uncharacterized protein n=1 Tax=Rhizophora mucronata TaxID=61149 RepID=A0A2P2LHR1_RHIMU